MRFFLKLFYAGIGLLLLPAAAHAEQVRCHYTYGGETKQLAALPVSSPYAVPDIAIGSYFHFRVVFQKQPADLASIKVYTYTERDDGLVLIYQATYPYPPASRAARYGFSGLQFVYEPMGDGELQYWCELTKSAKSAAPGRKGTR